MRNEQREMSSLIPRFLSFSDNLDLDAINQKDVRGQTII